MINILIADDNLDYATSLMNYINLKNESIRVCNIISDGNNVINFLNNYNNIDVVLLDYKMPSYNGKEILNQINNKIKYKKSFIIISGEFNEARNLYDNEMVYTVMNKLVGLSTIYSTINELIIHKEKRNLENDRKQKVIKELLYLGYDISHKGTSYLIDVINYIQNNQNKNLDNLNRDVYPIIAQIHNVNVHNIKCYIARETNEMYLKCKTKRLQDYFSYAEDTKPNVKTVIYTIINKIA